MLLSAIGLDARDQLNSLLRTVVDANHQRPDHAASTTLRTHSDQARERTTCLGQGHCAQSAISSTSPHSCAVSASIASTASASAATR